MDDTQDNDVNELNKLKHQLEKCAQRVSPKPGQYNTGIVITCCFKETRGIKSKSKCDAIGNIFKKVYGLDHRHLELPTADLPMLALMELAKSHMRSPDQLIVFFFSGHGFINQGVFDLSSGLEKYPRVDFNSNICNILAASRGQVLFILDCCCDSSGAYRGCQDAPPIEILCSSECGLATTGDTFFRALCETLESAPAQGLTVTSLHAQLVQKVYAKKGTPTRVSLRANHHTTTLLPVNCSTSATLISPPQPAPVRYIVDVVVHYNITKDERREMADKLVQVAQQVAGSVSVMDSYIWQEYAHFLLEVSAQVFELLDLVFNDDLRVISMKLCE